MALWRIGNRIYLILVRLFNSGLSQCLEFFRSFYVSIASITKVHISVDSMIVVVLSYIKSCLRGTMKTEQGCPRVSVLVSFLRFENDAFHSPHWPRKNFLTSSASKPLSTGLKSFMTKSSSGNSMKITVAQINTHTLE
jgi:hypothetical protein